MTHLNDKVAEAAEQVKKTATRTADGVGRVVAEVYRKSAEPIADVSRNGRDIVVDTAANILRVGHEAIDKPNGAGDNGKARDKKNDWPRRKG